ncbi:MAG: NAD(+) salvage pathway protein [Thelocarpon impressellum]|nr:MAG: NAD(+) salvage pathway protein [Thelocarpon impressellum]
MHDVPDDAFRPALLIVDFQEDFCPPHGSLAVTGARDIVAVINSLLELPFSQKIATQDWHPPDHISFAANHPPPDNKPFSSSCLVRNPDNPSETYKTRLWPVHCVQDTKGAKLIPELHAEKVHHIVKKGQDKRVEMYSAFTDPFVNPSIATSELAATLKEAQVTHVYVVGLAMDYCVKYTAIDAAKEGFVTYAVEEGIKAVDPSVQAWGASLDELKRAGVAMISLASPELNRVRQL